MEYVCKVGTPGGDVVERTFSAPDEASLRNELEQQGFYLFAAKPEMTVARAFWRKPKVPPTLLLVFAQEVAALLKAGLPLLQSLDVMLERQRHPLFKRSLAAIREKVKSGASLSDAVRDEGEIYPTIFGASLMAGERSGSLDTVLRRFSQYLRLNQSLKKKAVSASIYPAVLVIMMAGLISVMVVYVIPQFQSFYEGLGAELPGPTLAVLAFSTFVRTNLLVIVGILAAIIASVVYWFRRDVSGVTFDRVLLRIPYFGGLIRMYATSQLARTMATLLSGGLPLVNALEVSASSIGNRAIGAAVAESTRKIREGTSLTTALESTGMFEALPLEMVKVGEQTGALSEMLTAVAEFYDEDLDTRIASILSLVEPVLLVMMAIVVAGLLLAFYLPMFEAISAIQSKVR
jgi:type IV pilus assembly protein PilC